MRIDGCAGLDPETWQTVLESEGFRSVFFPAEEAHDLGQQIIVAESDGVVRQKHVRARMKPVKKTVEKDVTRISQSHMSDEIKQADDIDVTDRATEEYIRKTIREKLSESLKADPGAIDENKSFADYGLDSILGISFVQAVNQTLQTELESTILFDYSSAGRLTSYILSEYKDVIHAVLGQKVRQISTVRNLTSDNKDQSHTPGYPDYFHQKRFPEKVRQLNPSRRPAHLPARTHGCPARPETSD